MKKFDELFWKKANLLCLILKNNYSEASFIFDVMKSQNLLDVTFEVLVDKLLNEKQLEDFDFKDQTLTPLNLILMDINMQSISYKMIKDFGFEYKSLLLKLIYLNLMQEQC